MLAELAQRPGRKRGEVMIIHKGYIVEATESELWKYYLKQEFDDVMPFDTFLELMRNHNVHIIKDESEGEDE
jgi:hypothetical protein